MANVDDDKRADLIRKSIDKLFIKGVNYFAV